MNARQWTWASLILPLIADSLGEQKYFNCFQSVGCFYLLIFLFSHLIYYLLIIGYTFLIYDLSYLPLIPTPDHSTYHIFLPSYRYSIFVIINGIYISIIIFLYYPFTYYQSMIIYPFFSLFTKLNYFFSNYLFIFVFIDWTLI